METKDTLRNYQLIRDCSVKLAFVIPWYGESIGGGAEALCRSTVKALTDRGWSVEVLTTCVKEFHSDWNIDFHPPGLSLEGATPVRRFRVRKRKTAVFDLVNAKLMEGKPISLEEEKIFMREMIHAPGLYDFIRAHQEDYVFIFLPYMFGTTFSGSLVYPSRSVLIPCLHDESYAYLQIYKQMFASVRGSFFLSEPERQLAGRLYGIPETSSALVGMGIDLPPPADPERFRQKYQVGQFLLCAGRKDKGKNVETLVKYFRELKREENLDLQLVLIGDSNLASLEENTSSVRDLGYIPEQDKYDALHACLSLCLPSLYESFSIAMMECWAAGNPVIAHADCPITREHCLGSQGGLYFSNYEEFREIVLLLYRLPELRRQLGANGKRYVLRSYTWNSVCERYRLALQNWGLLSGVDSASKYISLGESQQ